MYTLSSEFEIYGVLRALASEQRLIQMSVPPSDASMLTSLLHIDGADNSLIFDGTSDPNLLRPILAAKALNFEASQGGVRISFKSGPATTCTWDERPALKLPPPTELMRLQRREAFRVATPVSNPVICAIPVKDGTVRLTLEDLSSSGIGASDPGHELDASLGQVFSGCRLEIPGSDPIEVTLRLAQMRDFERANKQMRHLGFAFVNLRGSALARIQRYVTQLEREALARSRGFK